MSISGTQKIALANGKDLTINFDNDCDVCVKEKKIIGEDRVFYTLNINNDYEEEISEKTFRELVELGVNKG